MLPIRTFVSEPNAGDQLACVIPALLRPSLAIQPLGVNVAYPYRHLMPIGSLLAFADPATVVCGAGFHTRAETCPATHDNIVAVRGPLTADRLSLTRAIPLGDPGLLLSSLVEVDLQGSREAVVVPHYVDANSPEIAELAHKHDASVVMPTNGWEPFVRAIAGSSLVLSSSLHGLVVADSFGVPNAGFFTGRIPVARQFKFMDHMSAVGRDDGLHPARALLESRRLPLHCGEVDRLLDDLRSALEEAIERCLTA